MKKFLIKSAALAALTVISAVSCTKEQNVDASVSQPELHFIIKTAENTPVKSFIDNNLDGTYTPMWTNGDQLAFFIGDITTSTTKPTATLPNIAATGKKAIFDGSVPTDLTEGSFVSFSPAGAFETGYTDGTVGINLSETQSPSTLTIDEACDVLVAKPCDFRADNGAVEIDDLFFKRIFSVVKVNLNGADALNAEKVTSFTLSAPVTLTGRAAVDLSTASFSKWNVENKSVTANYSEDCPVFGGDNGLENTIWLVVNPTTVANGSTVTFSGETENYTFSKEVNLSKDLVFPQSQMAVINLNIGKGNYTAKTVYSWDLSVNSTSEATADRISWSNSAAEMVCVKGENGTDANNYYPGVGENSTRFYKNSTLTIAPKNDKQLTYYIFEATTEGYASALSKSTWTNAKVTVDGTTVSVIADNPSSAVSCVIYATCGFTKVECHTDAVPVFPPSISVTAASIEVPAAGGNYTIKYTVKNPVDGKSISATSNQTWVKDFNYSTSGQVSFVVEKNAGEERTASITLSYEGAEAVTVSVTQAAAGSASKKTVTYTVTSTSAVSVSGDAPTGSSATFKNSFTTKDQLTKNNSMTLTLSGYQGMTVKGLTLSMRSNKDSGAGYLSVKAGETTIGTIGSASSGVKFNTKSWYGAWSQSYVDVTPTLSNTAYTIQNGDKIVIVIGATTSSLYCQSFTIEYAQGGSSEGGSDPVKLAAPSVSCTAKTENSLTFSWDAVANASGYQVSIDGGSTYGSTLTTTSYTWTGLTASTPYTLYVKAIGDNSNYTDSDAASASGTTSAGGSTGGEEKSEQIVLANGTYSGSGTSGIITWSGTSCSFVQTKENSSSSVSSSCVSAPRWYASHKVTFTANSGYTITKVVVKCTTEGYATALKNSTYSTGASASVNRDTVTITTSGNFSVTMGAQSRISTVTVYYNTSLKKLKLI